MTSQSSEEWRAIPGYEGVYEVSESGRVRSLDRLVECKNGRQRWTKGRELKTGRHPFGYRKVELNKGGVSAFPNVHTLVLLAFVGPCPGGMECCHNDGNPENNHVSNLRWGTRSENRRDAVRHGTQAEIARTHCPRGHLLAEPNLVRAQVKVGKRNCKACGRARSCIRSKGYSADRLKEIADSYYEKIMQEDQRCLMR